MTELNYWNEAAKDPDVLNKYICNLPDEDFYLALGEMKSPILDLGCGIGRLTPKGEYGTDISPKMISLARRNKPHTVFKTTGGMDIPYKAKMFNTVFSVLMFQHVDDITMLNYIAEAYRVLKSGGYFSFQFIEGDYNGFIDHRHKVDKVLGWIDYAGFTHADIERQLIHPEWTWITAVKS